MFETFRGLPIHILLNHAVVVGIPLVALASVAVALIPTWRARLAWPMVVVNALLVGATYAARQSGLWLFKALGNPPPALHHRSLGLTLIWFVIALFVASLLLALVSRADGGFLVGVVALIVVVAAGAATVQTVRTGEAGSRAVWEGRVSSG